MRRNNLNIGSILGGVVAAKKLIKDIPFSLTESRLYRSLIMKPNKKILTEVKNFIK